jgi:hypothetical protein
VDIVAVLFSVAMIGASLLALSGFILAKKPDAKAILAKIVPYQAMMGAFLLGTSAFNLIRSLPHIGDLFKSMWGIILIVALIVGLLLGFMFGMPLIAKWIPGDSNPEQKAGELAKKLSGVQTLLGAIGIVLGFIVLLSFGLNILH